MSDSVEKQLREDFLEILKANKTGSVVDDLISYLKKDYILLHKNPCYCTDCLHYGNTVGWLSPDYCKYYQRIIYNINSANTCKHFFSGEEEARKSIARLHNELTDEWIL